MDSNNGMDFDNVNNQAGSPAVTYDDLFPGLPETLSSTQRDNAMGKWNNKLRVGPRNVTQVL